MDDLWINPPQIGGFTKLTVKQDGSTVATNIDTLNFAEPLNVNISGSTATITVNVLKVDVIANRPAAAAALGMLFFATDLGYWSYSDGSTWTSLLIDLSNGITGTLAISHGGTGATTAATAFVNIKQDATGVVTGVLTLTNDLGGTAAAPTVVNLHLSGDTSIGHKLTNLTNGSTAQDAAAFGQIPTALPPSGAAGGDLGSTYPNPTVTNLHLSADTAIGHKLTSVSAPTAGGDATNKTYVDTGDAATLTTAEAYTDTKVALRMFALNPTAVKTSNYSAVANDLIPVDTTSGSVTVTLPTAPTDKSLVLVKQVTRGSTNTVVINTSGSDVFNKAGGGTSLTITLLNQALLLQYSITGAIWYVIADDLSLAQLDLRYPQLANDLGGTTTSPTVVNLHLSGDTAINHKLTNVTDPTNPQDAATKAYIDALLTSQDAKQGVAYASTAALPTNTYNNGASGVGATLTANANGFLIIDGVTTALAYVGQRVGVFGESTAANNGIYVITDAGSLITPYILTRTTDFDQPAEISTGDLIPVSAPTGLVTTAPNNGKVFIVFAPATVVVGTSSLTFSSVGNTYTAGTGLTLSSNQFAIDTSVVARKSDNLGVFSATTSAQLAGVLSDETGTGAAVFGTSPVITTPTGIVKGDVGLGNVDNTSDATKNAASVTLTNHRITKRVNTAADATSITIDSDSYDQTNQTNTQVAGTLTINAPTGTPTAGQVHILRVKCTNAQTLSFNAIFRAGTDIPLLTTTTGSSKIDYFGFIYNLTDTKWDMVSCVRSF